MNATAGTTVYTSNLNWGNRVSADHHDAKLLRDAGADVVLHQELYSPGHSETQLNDIYGSHYDTVQGVKGDARKTGIAIKATLEPKGSAFEKTAAPLGRDIARTTGMVNGKRVTFLSVHMEPARFGRAAWMRQAASIVAYVRTIRGPIILGGDFNAHMSSAQLKWFARAMGLKLIGNDIDGLMYSPSLVAHKPTVISNGKTLSDHGFFGATFTFKSHGK